MASNNKLSQPSKEPYTEENKSFGIQSLNLPDLPDIPSSHEGDATYNFIRDGDTSKTKKLFKDDDVCLLSNMKTGTLYTRWMGTIQGTPGETKCVVLTTLSGTVLKNQEIHWEKFVQRCMDLPKMECLTTIEGIGIMKPNVFLIAECLVCKTLYAHLLNFDQSSPWYSLSKNLPIPDAIKHITDILEGMEFINSYGFLHPGLSAKKILYTSQGNCKLYDFCLAEDAAKICIIMKTQMKPMTFNQFAPEVLLRNEYTLESDVWSTAVVIWEIISTGTLPFPTNTDCNLCDVLPRLKLRWPEVCLQLRNNLLFECWCDGTHLRPSLQQLRGSFREIFDNVLDNSLYEIPTSPTYASMSGKSTPRYTI